jgi:hypothetical protein
MMIKRRWEERKQHEIQLITFMWPLPMDAVEQVKSHLRYGDVSEIAEQLGVKILKVWDYLNRERSKYDVRIMLAILRKAEQNIEMELMMIPEEEHPPRLMMRKYLDKIFKFYKTKEQPKVRPYVRPGQKKD